MTEHLSTPLEDFKKELDARCELGTISEDEAQAALFYVTQILNKGEDEEVVVLFIEEDT